MDPEAPKLDSDLDAADLHLQAVLAWSAPDRPSIKMLAASVLLHALLVGTLSVPPGQDEDSKPRRTHHEVAIPVFSPPKSTAQAETKPPLESPELGIQLPQVQIQPAPPVPEVTVDLNAIELSFEADTTNQLPEVVRQQRGMLALLDKEDSGVAHYLFRPPAWEVHDRDIDVSARLRIAMEPSRKWEVFRTLAERYGVPLERYNACAVFDIAYRRCLLDSIRMRSASLKQPETASYVSAARLVFDAAKPCGIDVLEVSLASSPATRP